MGLKEIGINMRNWVDSEGLLESHGVGLVRIGSSSMKTLPTLEVFLVD